MKYHLLSIGISRHQNPVNNLSFSDKDALSFHQLFLGNVTNVGFQKLLTDGEATLSAIQTAFGGELKNQVESDDYFIFYYSGHGAIAEKDGAFSHYLVPFDVTEDIASSGVSVEYLQKTMSSLPCQRKLLFIDSCFSGAVNAKSKFYGHTFKGVKTVKSIAQSIGEGDAVFTACRDDEYSLEDPDLKSSVFTYYLLEELQKESREVGVAITDIVRPVTEAASTFVQGKYHCKQTPTFKTESKGVIYLPSFKKPITIKPVALNELGEQLSISIPDVRVPKIELEEKEQEKIVNDTIKFVFGTSPKDALSKSEFEKRCLIFARHIGEKWEEILTSSHHPIEEKLPEAIAKMEAESFQLLVLSGVLAIYGTEEQIKVFVETLSEVLKLAKGKSGIVAIIAVPEVIVLLTIYIFTLLALATRDFSRLKVFTNTRVYGWVYDGEPPKILALNHVHYTSALTGHADKVADFVRSRLESMKWLKSLHPRLENIQDVQIQASFLLSMLMRHNDIRTWPDFGRWYAQRITSIVERIKYDDQYVRQIASLFDVQSKDLRLKFAEYLTDFRKAGMAQYHWESISQKALFTPEELTKMKEENLGD